jgi:hypothetical protein
MSRMKPQDSNRPEPEEPTAEEFPSFAFGPGGPMPSVEEWQPEPDHRPNPKR